MTAYYVLWRTHGLVPGHPLALRPSEILVAGGPPSAHDPSAHTDGGADRDGHPTGRGVESTILGLPNPLPRKRIRTG